MASSSKMLIRYSADQLIKIGRAMKPSVPTILYASPKVKTERKDASDEDVYIHDSAGFLPFLHTALRENLKRVYFAAKPLDHSDKKYHANGYGRNSWIILAETVSGKCLSVDLKKIDPQGNTLVVVKPEKLELVEDPCSPRFGQLKNYCYSQCGEPKFGLHFWSFVERIEGFGLSRYQLRANWIEDVDDGGDDECDHRGNRFWVWSVLRIFEPKLTGFIPDYNNSPLMKIKKTDAPDADANWVHPGRFLPPKEKREIAERSGMYIPLKSKRTTPFDKGFSGPAAASTSAQNQGHNHGIESNAATGLAESIRQQGLADSMWASKNQSNNHGAGSNVHPGPAQALTQQGLANLMSAPQNHRATLAGSLGPIHDPVNHFADHMASDDSVVQAVRGWRSFVDDHDYSNDVEGNANPAWLRSDDGVEAFSQSPVPFGSNMGATDPFGFPPQPRHQNRDAEHVETFLESTSPFSINMGVDNPFGAPTQQPHQYQDTEDVEAFAKHTDPFGSNIGLDNPFGSNVGVDNDFASPRNQPHQGDW